jgi:glycerate-2-kinase
MIIKNFKSLTLNKERKIALEIVEAGLSALDYEKILHGFYGSNTDYTDNKNQRLSVLDLRKSANIYLIGFGKGSSKIADILRKKIKFKEIYVIDVETDKHGFKNKRGSFIDQSTKRYQYEVRNPHKSVETKYPYQSVQNQHESDSLF